LARAVIAARSSGIDKSICLALQLNAARIEYDADKSAWNEEVRGLSFGMVDRLDCDSAMVVQDTRQ
jgi:hypothetical protein